MKKNTMKILSVLCTYSKGDYTRAHINEKVRIKRLGEDRFQFAACKDGHSLITIEVVDCGLDLALETIEHDPKNGFYVQKFTCKKSELNQNLTPEEVRHYLRPSHAEFPKIEAVFPTSRGEIEEIGMGVEVLRSVLDVAKKLEIKRGLKYVFKNALSPVRLIQEKYNFEALVMPVKL